MSLLFRAEAGESHDCSHFIGGSCIIIRHFLNLPLFVFPLLLSVFFDLLFLWIIEIILLTNYTVNKIIVPNTISSVKTNLFLQFFHSLLQIIIFLFLLKFLLVLCKPRFNLIQCGSLYLHGHAQITLICRN